MYMPKNDGGDFTPPPAGTHLAVCYRLIDLGTQRVEYQGQVKFQRKIALSWELPDEKMEDGRPFTVSKRYTLSSHEKATLRIDLEGWRGKAFTDAELDPDNPNAFNIRNILGKGCVLTVVHNDRDGKTFANVKGVSKLMKGQTAPQPTNPVTYLSLEEGQFDQITFDNLSSHLQDVIKASPEYRQIVSGHRTNGHGEDAGSSAGPLDDDIPFAPW